MVAGDEQELECASEGVWKEIKMETCFEIININGNKICLCNCTEFEIES